MNLHRHRELLDKLAAEYALGTLRGGARRRLETLAANDATIRRRLQFWQHRIDGLAEVQTEHLPSPELWQRITRELGWPAAQTAPSAHTAVHVQPAWPQRVWQAIGFWRLTALSATAIAVAAVMLTFRLTETIRTTPVIHSVAVLSDKQSQPAMLVTFDERTRTLTIKQMGQFAPGDNQTFELWGLPSGANPKSLGVLGRDRVLRVHLAEAINQLPALAISLEPQGGSPNPNGPSGPVMFSGPILNTAL